MGAREAVGCTSSYQEVIRRHIKNKQSVFWFLTGIGLTDNVVLVSGAQQRDSAIHIHTPILSQTLLPSRSPEYGAEFPLLKVFSFAHKVISQP